MLDIKENIDRKAKELNRLAKELHKISIQWENPLHIKCTELEEKKEELASVLSNSGKQKYLPAVYFFEILSAESGNEVVNMLVKFKNKKEHKRKCPLIDSRRGDSKFLYCGSVKKGLHKRFIQHLGFGSDSTYALNLKFWAKTNNLEFLFHYAWLNTDQNVCTELVESALAEKLKPLVGKLTRI
ncbi:MAG: hypothetical protein MH137_00480 [Flavobacteriales bacterium]|nr:hypothetical protein [Flavobacteriales bacterium]